MEIVIKRQGDYAKKSQNLKLKYSCQNIGGLVMVQKTTLLAKQSKNNNDAGQGIKI